MMRSLFSGVSGLKGHQTKMDVIGNNIANVNTTGFKRNRVNFSTMLSQTLAAASAPNGTTGGTNPIQVGSGVSIGSIDQIMTQGSMQTTGNPTDMMIQGSGFFTLSPDGGTTKVYSRSGAFSLDSNGDLVDPASGAYVLDSGGQKINIPSTVDSFSISQAGVITTITAGVATTGSTIGITTFTNPAGLVSIGGSFYNESTNSGTATLGAAGTATKVVSNTLEMSNVDLSTEFTDMITAQRGFQANSRVITVSDSLLEELISLKRQ